MSQRYTVAHATGPNRPLEAYGEPTDDPSELRPVVARAIAEGLGGPGKSEHGRRHIYVIPVDDVGLLARTAAYRMGQRPPADPRLPLAEVRGAGVRVDVTLRPEDAEHARRMGGAKWIAQLVTAHRLAGERK